MFPCKQCGKSYAYVHKLHHHKLWSCKYWIPETELRILNLPRPRGNDSNNDFTLLPTPERIEGEAEVVNGVKEIKDEDNSNYQSL